MENREIDLYCKNCKKSFKIAHIVTGKPMTPVLPNVVMKCHQCRRTVILKNFTEEKLLENAIEDKKFI